MRNSNSPQGDIAMNSLRALALWLALFPPGASAASKDDYPQRPLRLVVPVPPGGAGDFTGRLVGAKLAEALGQNVVVENRGGAAGVIATEFVSQAAPDGYTFLLSSSTTHGIGPVLYRKLPYDAQKNFTHIGLIATVPAVMAVNQSVPVHSVKEFVALAKAKPGALLFGSSGSGGPPHLMGELFKAVTGAPITHVPYKGSGPGVTDLLSGQVQLMIVPQPVVIGHVRAGRLKALAVTSLKRSSVLPSLPTVAEAGLAGYDVSAWYGVVAPAGTPAEIVGRLNAEIARVLGAPETRDQLLKLGAEPSPNTSMEFAGYIRSETLKWAKVIKDSGARVD